MAAGLLLPPAAWVATSQFRADAGAASLESFRARRGAINRLWSAPSDSTSTHGLGLGISYAWDPVVCKQSLEEKFSENGMWGLNFAGCDAIDASMRRAFKSWADNHPKLKFFDITADCELYRQAQGLPPRTRCNAAEVWITTTPNTSSVDVAATTRVSYRWAVDFFHTNGRPASAGVWEAVQAEIGFNTNNICWYLDATFCGGFHSLKASMGVDSSIWFLRVLLFGVWAIAVAEVLWRLYQFIRQQCIALELSSSREDKSSKALSQEGAMEFYYQLERMTRVNYSPLVLRIIFLTLPIIMYTQIVLPCWECYDFEAAATHEIGHVLGLEHPDAGATRGQNYFYDRGFSNEHLLSESDLTGYGSDQFAVNCTDPTSQVHYRSNSTPIDETIMQVFTFNNPSTCIFQDDLDAINVLYPVCNDAQRVPRCIKDPQYLGLVRTSAYVLLPLVVGLALVILTNKCSKTLQARRRRRLVEKRAQQISAYEKGQRAHQAYKKAQGQHFSRKREESKQTVIRYLQLLNGGTDINLAPVRDSGPLEGLSGQKCIRAAGSKWRVRAARKGHSRNAVVPLERGSSASQKPGNKPQSSTSDLNSANRARVPHQEGSEKAAGEASPSKPLPYRLAEIQGLLGRSRTPSYLPPLEHVPQAPQNTFDVAHSNLPIMRAPLSHEGSPRSVSPVRAASSLSQHSVSKYMVPSTASGPQHATPPVILTGSTELNSSSECHRPAASRCVGLAELQDVSRYGALCPAPTTNGSGSRVAAGDNVSRSRCQC